MKSCPECHAEYEDAFESCSADAATLTTKLKDDAQDSVSQNGLVGTRLADRYEIVSVIGRGGMGVVYKARHEIMDRLMAIKMLHSHMVAEAEAVKRFFREAQTVSQVKHHHIVTLYDFGMSSQGQPYIVMDYLEGQSLKDVVKTTGVLSFERADHIFRQVTDGLTAAHALNVVHRDMKPENIMLTKNSDDLDWVTLVDFGLSKLKDSGGAQFSSITKIGDVCGSPPYMSPEQCLSSSIVDPRSDIYSLAVVIYEALANKLPFNVKSAMEMLDCHLYGTPIPFNLATAELKVCTELTHVLAKAMDKAPEKRQQSMEELGMDLHEALMRDSLKLRTFRHRVEIVTSKGHSIDLAGESACAEANKAAISSEVLDSFKFLAQQAQLEQDLRLQADKESEAKGVDQRVGDDTTSGDNDQAKRKKWAKDTPNQALNVANQNDSDENNRLVDNCSYCGTPVQHDVNFCLNCQRQHISSQELSVLHSVAGRHNLPKLRPRAEESARASMRAKLANERAIQLKRLQEALKVVLAVLIIYVTYISVDNPYLLRTVQKMAVWTHARLK